MTPTEHRFHRASARFGAVVGAVAGHQWDLPSRCEGWSVRDVVQHVADTERDFARQRSLAVPDVEGLEPAAAWPLVRDVLAAALASPSVADQTYDGYFGPTTLAETVDRFYTVDLVVHRWDIASAVGLDDAASLDADELAHVREAMLGFPEEMMRSPSAFGPVVDVPADAAEQVRVLAFLGRAP